MAQTVYVEVQASSVATFSVDVPSGADTTSGYYITYEMSENGGFSGQDWYFGYNGNPLNAAGLNNFEAVLEKYNSNGGHLNDVFASWLTNSGAEAVHSFCNTLWNYTYSFGCITMV